MMKKEQHLNSKTTTIKYPFLSLKQEKGSGGPIVYLACAVLLTFVIYFFVFITYRANIYTLKDDMETNLHIVENYCLTVNQKKSNGLDAYERERSRVHIITIGINGVDVTDDKRAAQAGEVGAAFATQFQKIFHLDGSKPKGGYLLEMSKHHEDEASIKIKEVRIYDPIYVEGTSTPVYCGSDTHEHIESCKSPSSIGQTPTGFWITKSTSEWYTYILSFDEDNNYTGCAISKSNTAPTLYTGVSAEGATIESKISASFFFPKNLIQADGNKKTVEVQEAIDIVYANSDNRKK